MTDTEKLIGEAREYVADPILNDYDRTSMPFTLISRLASALEAKQADTERYRFLRDNDLLFSWMDSMPDNRAQLVTRIKLRGGLSVAGHHDTLDAALDAAMSPASLSTGNRENG